MKNEKIKIGTFIFDKKSDTIRLKTESGFLTIAKIPRLEPTSEDWVKMLECLPRLCQTHPLPSLYRETVTNIKKRKEACENLVKIANGKIK